MTKQEPLFAGAWRYYSSIVATLALLLMVLNALVGADWVSPTASKWIGVGIGAITLLLVWLRDRARQLGIAAKPKPGEPDP